MIRCTSTTVQMPVCCRSALPQAAVPSTWLIASCISVALTTPSLLRSQADSGGGGGLVLPDVRGRMAYCGLLPMPFAPVWYVTLATIQLYAPWELKPSWSPYSGRYEAAPMAICG